MSITTKDGPNGSLVITITLTAKQLTCLYHDLPGKQGVIDWFDPTNPNAGPVGGKISKCKDRLIQEGHPKLLADPAVSTTPGNENELVAAIVARSDYKDRAARDADGSALVGLADDSDA